MCLEPAVSSVVGLINSSDEYSGYIVTKIVTHCVENLTVMLLERMPIKVCTMLYNTLLLLCYVNFYIAYKQHAFSVLCYLVWSIIKYVS
jgi:hypothetical protein